MQQVPDRYGSHPSDMDDIEQAEAKYRRDEDAMERADYMRDRAKDERAEERWNERTEQ